MTGSGGGFRAQVERYRKVGATVVMMRKGRNVAVLIRTVECRLDERRSFDGGVRLSLMVIVRRVIVVMITGGDLEIGLAGELNRVLKPMLPVAHGKALQRDHQGHGEADAELTKETRQETIPPGGSEVCPSGRWRQC